MRHRRRRYGKMVVKCSAAGAAELKTAQMRHKRKDARGNVATREDWFSLTWVECNKLCPVCLIPVLSILTKTIGSTRARKLLWKVWAYHLDELDNAMVAPHASKKNAKIAPQALKKHKKGRRRRRKFWKLPPFLRKTQGFRLDITHPVDLWKSKITMEIDWY